MTVPRIGVPVGCCDGRNRVEAGWADTDPRRRRASAGMRAAVAWAPLARANALFMRPPGWSHRRQPSGPPVTAALPLAEHRWPLLRAQPHRQGRRVTPLLDAIVSHQSARVEK